MKNRIFILIAFGAVSALIIFGCGAETAVAPDLAQDQQAILAKASSSTSDLWFFPGYPVTSNQVPGASSTLVRTKDGITVTIHTSELDPGAAYTVWWVIFNNPENCVGGCGEDDLFRNGANASVVWATGHVIGNNGVGNFAAHLKEEDNPSGLVLFGPGLQDAEGAAVHLIVRTHGQPIPGVVNEQISTVNGGCPPNTCADQQFGIHEL